MKGFSSTLNSATAGLDLVDGNAGFGYGFSLEAGQKVALGDEFSITPQAQLAYSSVRFDAFEDAFGADVSLGGADRLIGRLGLSADYETEWTDPAGEPGRTHLYGIANLYYDFGDGAETEVEGVSLASHNDPLGTGIGLGGSINWAGDRLSLHGEAHAGTSLGSFADSFSLGATAGIRGKL